jgi:hypothetical protein
MSDKRTTKGGQVAGFPGCDRSSKWFKWVAAMLQKPVKHTRNNGKSSDSPKKTGNTP